MYDTGYVNAMGGEALDYIRAQFENTEPKISRVSLGFLMCCWIWQSR